MAEGRSGSRRAGPVERAAAVVPPPAGRGYQWITLVLLVTSTVALVVIAGELVVLLGRLQTSGAVAAIASDVAALKTEVAGFRADSAKANAGLAKSAAEISDRVNTTNLAIDNMALGLAKKP